MQPADLVLIHNYVLQALAKPANELNDDFDFWASLPNIKGPFIKYCQVFQARLRTVLRDYRIETDPEDHATTVKAKGFIEKYSARIAMSKQKLCEFTIETQFLEADKKQYGELSAEFANISHMPKSSAALENLKMMVLLDLKILLGADIPWQLKSVGTDGGGSGAVDGRTLVAGALGEGSAGDDRDSSSSEEDGQVQPGKESVSTAKPDKPTSPARAARGGAAASPAPVDGSPAKGGPSRGSLRGKGVGRDAALDEQLVLDVRDFTTWTPETWELLDLSEISFPEDKPVISNKLFYPLAMIFSHSIEMRTKHKALHVQLCKAWVGHFGSTLTGKALGRPPNEGPYAFSAEEAKWCEGTLRFLQMGAAAVGTSVPSLCCGASRRLIEAPSSVRRSGRQVPVDGGKAAAEPAPRKRKDQRAEDGAGG